MVTCWRWVKLFGFPERLGAEAVGVEGVRHIVLTIEEIGLTGPEFPVKASFKPVKLKPETDRMLTLTECEAHPPERQCRIRRLENANCPACTNS